MKDINKGNFIKKFRINCIYYATIFVWVLSTVIICY